MSAWAYPQHGESPEDRRARLHRDNSKPGRLWSLWEMINYDLGRFVAADKLLKQELAQATAQVITSDSALPPKPVSQADRDRCAANLQYVQKNCRELGFPSTDNRFERLWSEFRIHGTRITYAHIALQLQIISEAIEDDAKYERFFHYPSDRARLLLMITVDWEKTLHKFPSIRDHIDAAVDCYALGHNLGSVFYLMRVMEIGVRRFGKRLHADMTFLSGSKLKERTWHQILDNMNDGLKKLKQDTPARVRRHERYSAIQSYLYAVKDAWRNPTMHPRAGGYTDLQTLDLINHVRAFMNGLSESLA